MICTYSKRCPMSESTLIYHLKKCLFHTACSNGDAILQPGTGEISKLCYNGTYHRVAANTPPIYANTITSDCEGNRESQNMQNSKNTVYILGALLGVFMTVLMATVVIVLVVYWFIARRKMDRTQIRHHDIPFTGLVACRLLSVK